jgi:hypothetical protein
MTDHRIPLGEAKKAREAFEANDPRDLFYRAATELVRLALQREIRLNVTEALAVLLQTWNRPYYRYRKFDDAHFVSIERLVSRHQTTIEEYRKRAIDGLDCRDEEPIENLFQAFEEVLGPVGAAKALHLLAPKLFPLWDRAIAQAYGLALGRGATNGKRYWRFILICQAQCRELQLEDPGCRNPLKLIDEYNFCKYTKRWVP